MPRTRNRKGENSRRRKHTLIKKAYEYGELSGADIAFFIYKSGRWFTYRSTDRQSFPPSWDKIVSFVTKCMHAANKKLANVISTPDKSAASGFPTSRARLFYNVLNRKTLCLN
jgi:SRF-type transcription factor (DNA-binding and dimerisation domain)